MARLTLPHPALCATQRPFVQGFAPSEALPQVLGLTPTNNYRCRRQVPRFIGLRAAES